MSRMGRFAREEERPRSRESRAAVGEADREEGRTGGREKTKGGEGGLSISLWI